jgi:hypothetical protein
MRKMRGEGGRTLVRCSAIRTPRKVWREFGAEGGGVIT